MTLMPSLTLCERAILDALDAPGTRPLTINELTSRTRHTHGALVSAAKQLIKWGLIDRFSGSPGRWAYLITPDGERERAQLRLGDAA